MIKKQIGFGAILSYCSIAINILAGLLYTPWMIDQIGKSDYALYTLSNSLITLFLVDFGLSAATARYVSKYIAEDNVEKANDFLGAVYKLYMLVDMIISIVLILCFMFIDQIYVKLSAEELSKFKVVYSISAIYAVVNFPFVTLNGVLTAHEKFIQLKCADIFQRLLAIVLTVIALSLGMGLYALVTVNAISGLLILVYKYFVIKRSTKTKVNFKYKDKGLFKEIFAFSSWATIATVAQLLIFNITPTLLGIVASTSDIAVFGIVITIEAYTYMLTAATKGMFMPKIARIYAKSTTQDIMPLMLKVGNFQFFLNGLIVVVFAVLGKNFMVLWMGQDYIMAYWGILLVIVPGLFYNSLQIANTAMLVENKVKYQALITLTIGVFNLVFATIFSAWFGFLGACFSIFLAYILRAILYHIFYQKNMNLNMWLFVKKCYLKNAPTLAIAFLLGFFVNFLVDDSGWIVFVIKCIIIALIYAILFFVLNLSKSEKKTLISYAKNIIR